jgi:GDPmannose 4,6-dehydratase
MKKALITGITGQCGSYLAELLLSKGYEVHGIIRRASTFNTERIDHVFGNKNMTLHYGDLSDSNIINYIINNARPDEIYNLGAQSHVQVSFTIPEYTSDVVGIGNLRILEAIRASKQDIKMYQASTSELFGSSPAPQCETTPFRPQSPYAVSKLMAYWNTVNYRHGYNIFACNGILFNNESPRRGKTFVTRKIIDTLVDIYNGDKNLLELGFLDAYRDWGFSPEYVEFMWLMLQQEQADDYVIGTGETHTVKELCDIVISRFGVKGNWQGSGLDEKFIVESGAGNIKDGQVLVSINPKYFRPTEVPVLQADMTKAKEKLDWVPKIRFNELVDIMMNYSYKLKTGKFLFDFSNDLKSKLEYFKWTTIQ